MVLAHDPSFYRESGGENHFATSPELLAEDFSAGVDFLGTLHQLDPEWIGVVGICASGGFAVNADAIDTRIEAVA